MSGQKQQVNQSEEFWKGSKSICAEVVDYCWAIAVYGMDSVYMGSELSDSLISLHTPLLTHPFEEDIFKAELKNSDININEIENSIEVFPFPSVQKTGDYVLSS